MAFTSNRFQPKRPHLFGQYLNPFYRRGRANVACEHPDHPNDSLYLVCSSYGRAHEMESRSLVQIVGKAAKTRGFKPEKPIVEVPGCAVRAV